MNRLENVFNHLRSANQSALITFITAGDPNTASTVPAMHALVEGGADVIELGVPFSDPEADGPAIQKSSERALANGMTLEQTCRLTAEFRQTNSLTPVVLMGYLNPILALGIEKFTQLAKESGVDGLIVVNLPPEEAKLMRDALDVVNISLIMLVAPTTQPDRIRLISQCATGFLYYVSIKGITGADHLNVEDVKKNLDLMRQLSNLPIAVGFGVKDAIAAKAIATTADGVVVGSALVETMANANDQQQLVANLTKQVDELNQGVVSARLN